MKKFLLPAILMGLVGLDIAPAQKPAMAKAGALKILVFGDVAPNNPPWQQALMVPSSCQPARLRRPQHDGERVFSRFGTRPTFCRA